MKVRSKSDESADAPTNYHDWLAALYPLYVRFPLGRRHIDMWDWVWSIEPGHMFHTFVGIWPRGSGKSTTSELAAVALGCRKRRKYCWYISETQAQADQHVDSIASMIENPFVSYYYPAFAERRVGKYGNVKAWRRNRLRCGNGFTIDAMGLDSARRGSKVEEQRPDFIILDDIDGKHDSTTVTDKKIATITTSILPAGSFDVTVLAVQNLIIPDGVFSRLANGKADFLHDRIVSGPFPAVIDLKVDQQDGRFVIRDGLSTWEGQNLSICQKQIDTWGYSAFLKEAQHDVEISGGLFDHIQFRHCTKDEVPKLIRTVCWADPAISTTDKSDSMGIQIDGIGEDGIIYRLYSWEDITSPLDTLQRAILKSKEYGCETIGVETNQGGDTWYSVYERARMNLGLKEEETPGYVSEKASSGTGGKTERASRMLTDYENGSIVHVLGTHKILESALRRFPIARPYDLVDASFWAWNDLREGASWLLY